MTKSKSPAVLRKYLSVFKTFLIIFGVCVVYLSGVSAQTAAPFRVGERLTYNVSFGKFNNVAYAETYVVSRGRIGEKDVVEIRSKFKTLDLVSAAFYSVNESRVTFASPETGLPLYIEIDQKGSGFPKETILNYLTAPTPNLDLSTLLYKIRSSGGTGSFMLQENEKVYSVTFTVGGKPERVKTDAGEFDTSTVNVQSEYFTESGLSDVRVNLTNDEAKIPALIRFKTDKGEFRSVLASSQMIELEVPVQTTPTPVPTPGPAKTPIPVATPQPYINNQPLNADLAFQLGETLEYRISSGGQAVGTFQLQAKERKEFKNIDSLLLTAIATNSQAGNLLFATGDSIRAQVDPDTLAPQQVDIKLSGSLSSLNRSAIWDTKGSSITFNGTEHVDVPVGTQSMLSLIYAIRSFNLKPSPNLSNPVNDTRVAVFWETKPYVFTLRPSLAEVITLQGEKVSAQLITISTGGQNPQLDQLNIKIWLGNDARRLPLRFSVGSYQADLASNTVIQPN
jgi:hypothetical protein